MEKIQKGKNIYDGVLAFRGIWRKYQERILRESGSYLADGKLHIVAPPGAGKTTLGIELIRRCGAPCLILSPRIVIREQWLERIRRSFLAETADPEAVLSDDIRRPGLVTSVTYQTLFCAVTGGREHAEDGGDEKAASDFSGFHLIRCVRDAGIRVICLDECHHLKNEWWKALERFMSELGDVTVIALTATPPYDAPPAQWERYLAMCGPVDAEITVPELVKEGSLCPHQDYVWFNHPDEEETEQIRRFQQEAADMFQMLMTDASLRDAAASHPALPGTGDWPDRMLENPGYLSALLVYCQAWGIPFSEKWCRLLNVRSFPEMNEKWMELFLQGFLYDDRGNYACDGEYREALIRQLRSRGLVSRGKVQFLVNEKIEKLLTNSRGKLKSVLQIAACEHRSMGEKLRMLVLTDHVRKDYRSALGNPDREIGLLGVLPLFELLRRRGTCSRLGILCGSMIVIPDSAVEAFYEEAAAEDNAEKRRADRESVNTLPEKLPEPGEGCRYRIRPLTVREEGSPGYSEVMIQGSIAKLIRIVTRLFERGYIQILIGTGALLGEGWDSPCVNSLVLASSVSSSVMGAQMRGRAVRTNPGDPDKVSSIWHLVCIPGQAEWRERKRAGDSEPGLSEDFRMLEKRMERVTGVDTETGRLETGTGRLGIIPGDYSRWDVEEMNRETELRAADRGIVAAAWKQAAGTGMLPVEKELCSVKKERLRPGRIFRRALYIQALAAAAEAANIIYRIVRTASRPADDGMFLAVTVLFLAGTFWSCRKIWRNLTPVRRLQRVGQGVLRALARSGAVAPDCVCVTEAQARLYFSAWLEGGTEREKTLFADTLEEVLAPVDNQRYLIRSGRKLGNGDEYYCVPRAFSGTRERAEHFLGALEPELGRMELVYTRNPEGRRILLRARARAFSSRNAPLTARKKCWEYEVR